MCFAQIDAAVKEFSSLIIQGGSLAVLAYFLIFTLPKVVQSAMEALSASQTSQAKEREARDERFVKTVDVIQAQQNERNGKLEAAIVSQTNQLGSKLDHLGIRLEAHSEAINKAVSTVCKGGR